MQNTTFTDSKPHYALLDGLRGVAALLVLWYHVNEGFGFAKYVNGLSDGMVEVFNHGYLAVDFFFILSGFVIGYAYDDRWQRGFTMCQFFKRRLIRLHPMVIMGALIGLVFFLLQGGVDWNGTHAATSMVMLSLLMAMFMIPAVPGARCDVRGNGEMFPLNGPSWSLFFEYIGNILYALFIRRLSTRVLAVVTAVLGAGLVWFTASDASHTGSFGVGWTLDGLNLWGGMLRMMFPYTLGMLLARVFRPVRVRGAFWLCALALAGLFAVPYIAPSASGLCLNGVYEAVCIVLVFPVIVWLAASGATTDGASTAVCCFLGDISYPLYMVHYPVMYLFYSWLIKSRQYTFADTWAASLGVMLACMLLAWLALRFYDLPVRRWLSRR